MKSKTDIFSFFRNLSFHFLGGVDSDSVNNIKISHFLKEWKTKDSDYFQTLKGLEDEDSLFSDFSIFTTHNEYIL